MAYLPYTPALLYAKLVGLILYKMIIWSAVVAGCGIMALLGRHTAIHHFGTDHFTGNVLFAVFFILLIGLFFSIQPMIEAIFKSIQSQFRDPERVKQIESEVKAYEDRAHAKQPSPTSRNISPNTTALQ